ncbi:GLPGLI family protein [Tenacibaculum maritimum]|uniref:GLPGLI family protein n=1 Tax=Tenacibaculum maritimum TaxID=107401 RepID=UPI00133074AB|nr:GLPGLI family protein [Tenacibaculum maritimum]MCD9582205.1 GLPGLI family protein [Tenacibaculum maritimum]MCD9636584.1 GLPGLI family protein [Tenacibaculum maritimum]
MREITFVFTFCIVFASKAQNICGKVIYKEESNIDLYYKTVSLMVFNQKESYTKYIRTKDVDSFLEKKYTDENVQEIIKSSNTGTKYIYVTKKDTYFTDTTWKKTLTVREDDFKWNWKIFNETKKVGDISCQKAEIYFRGRYYTAWFAMDIPVAFGPWKFKGLPGLILEVYDSEKLWHMRAQKIDINNSGKCIISFNTKKILKAMSISEYLKEWERLVDESIQKFASQLPKGATIDLNSKCEDCEAKRLEIFKQ